jgi:hypothetical protein
MRSAILSTTASGTPSGCPDLSLMSQISLT